MTQTATTLTNWLSSLKDINDIKPIHVTIQGTHYDGASYVDARKDGARDERIYLLGDLPACYKRSTHTVFRFPDDDRDWYICAWITTDRITPEMAHYHPCGKHFMLTPWTLPEAIDEECGRPYKRIQVKKDDTSTEGTPE